MERDILESLINRKKISQSSHNDAIYVKARFFVYEVSCKFEKQLLSKAAHYRVTITQLCCVTISIMNSVEVTSTSSKYILIKNQETDKRKIALIIIYRTNPRREFSKKAKDRVKRTTTHLSEPNKKQFC